ncbi:MAG: potassium channel family protein [Chloroflexi bacterium]|nr:potassium channel family protein [Chloroflexota bacterium]
MKAPAQGRIARWRLITRVQHMLEGPGTFLAVVFAVALAAELVLSAQGRSVPEPLTWLLFGIWGFFVLQFILGIAVSPDRVRYLRRNWLTALSLVVPFLRAFRVLRVVRVLRATNALRVLAGFNRAARTLDAALAWTRAGYAVALTATAVVLGSAALLMFEVDAPDSTITSYGEALWWAAATITTVGATSEPVTLGGRIVALALMLAGLVLLGYVAGVLGAILFGKREKRRESPTGR